MLVRAKLISQDQLAAVHTASGQSSSFIEALLQLNLLSEAQLVEFLRAKLLLPVAEAQTLNAAETEAIASLPHAFAKQLGVLPLAKDSANNLTIAMMDPTDMKAIDTISAKTGSYLIRMIAAPSALRKAVELHYGQKPPASNSLPPPPPKLENASHDPTSVGKSSASVKASPAPLRSPSPPPTKTQPTLATKEASQAPSTTRSPPPPPMKTRPGVEHDKITQTRTPLPPTRSSPPPPPSSSAQPIASTPLSAKSVAYLLSRLGNVEHRDQILAALLDVLAQGFTRVILFTHIKNEIRGHDARGEDLLVDAVRQIRIPAQGPSLFSTAIVSQGTYLGPMQTTTKIDQAFANALGGLSGEILIMPLILRGKVPVLVFASGTSHKISGNIIQELSAAVSSAFERLIILEKSRRSEVKT